VQLLIVTRALSQPAGSETYVETVAPELRQLGHEVQIYSPDLGLVADRLRADGFEVHHSLDHVAEPDVVHAQHASTALRARARFATTPMAYVCHSSVLDIEDVPATAAPQAIVVLNDLVRRRVEASALGGAVGVFRLNQPVPVPFTDRGHVPISDQPSRATLVAHRAALVEPVLREVCRAQGIVLHSVGGTGERVDDLTSHLMGSDIVFAVGRSLLEAMALGRAAFLIDERGSGGFVTADSYPGMERGAFAAFDPEPCTAPLLTAHLQHYEPELGRLGRELALRHHSARVHARDLVEVYQAAIDAGPPAPVDVRSLLEAYADSVEATFHYSFTGRDAQWHAANLERRNGVLEQEKEALADELRALEGTRVVRWAGPVRGGYEQLRDRLRH
jgi:hypothetical protein